MITNHYLDPHHRHHYHHDHQVARQAELGEVAGLPDRYLNLLEEVEGQVSHHRVGDISNYHHHHHYQVEGQVSHHRVEDAEEARVGRRHRPEALQEVAGETRRTLKNLETLENRKNHPQKTQHCLLPGIAMVALPCPQPSFRVACLPGLAANPSGVEGDKFLAEKTLPQVAGNGLPSLNTSSSDQLYFS